MLLLQNGVELMPHGRNLLVDVCIFDYGLEPLGEGTCCLGSLHEGVDVVGSIKVVFHNEVFGFFLDRFFVEFQNLVLEVLGCNRGFDFVPGGLLLFALHKDYYRLQSNPNLLGRVSEVFNLHDVVLGDTLHGILRFKQRGFSVGKLALHIVFSYLCFF